MSARKPLPDCAACLAEPLPHDQRQIEPAPAFAISLRNRRFDAVSLLVSSRVAAVSRFSRAWSNVGGDSEIVDAYA